MSDTHSKPRDDSNGQPRRMRPYGEVNGRDPIRQSPRHYPESAEGDQRMRESLADRLRQWRQPRKAERRRALAEIRLQLEDPR